MQRLLNTADDFKAAVADIGGNRLPLLADEIRQAVASARQNARATITSAISAGEKLIEAKTLVPHGAWLPWLEANCEISERQAQKYMRLARSKSAVTADLGIEAAIDALASGPARPEFLPLAGHLAVGLVRAADGYNEIWVSSSYQHAGFYYINHVSTSHGGGGFVTGTRKPVKADFATAFVYAICKSRDLDPDALRWRDVESCSWAYNLILFPTFQSYLDSIEDISECLDLARWREPDGETTCVKQPVRQTAPALPLCVLAFGEQEGVAA